MSNSSFLKKAFTNDNWSKIADDYERVAEPFITRWASDALRFAHQRMLDTVAASDEASSPTFVDVGCGTGALCLAFAEEYLTPKPSQVVTDATKRLKKTQVIATDVADGMLARLDERLNDYPRYQHFRKQITTMQMDGQVLDKLDDASADIVASNFAHSVFPERVKAWNSAARVLREGGLLFTTTWDRQSANTRWVDDCVAFAREAQRRKIAASSNGENKSEPSLKSFVPSERGKYDVIANELKAAGFHDIEVFRAQHSVVCETPSTYVQSTLENPGFRGLMEHVEREHFEEYLYAAMLKDGTFDADVDNKRNGAPLTIEDVKKSTRPVTVEFIGHVIIATKK